MTQKKNNYKLGEDIIELSYDKKWVQSIKFSPNNKYIAAGGVGAVVVVWDIETGEIFKTLDGSPNMTIRAVDFSPNGNLIAAGGNKGVTIVWDFITGERVYVDTNTNSSSYVNSLDFNSLGNKILIGSTTREVYEIDLTTKNKKTVYSKQNSPIRSVIYSVDEKTGISSGLNGRIKAWDIETGDTKSENIGNLGTVSSLHNTQNGEDVVGIGYEGNLRVCNIETGETISDYTDFDYSLADMSLGCDFDTILLGGVLGELRLWSLENEGEIYDFGKHRSEIRSVDISSNGKMGAFGSFGLVKVFSLGDVVEVKDPNLYLFKHKNMLYKPSHNSFINIGDTDKPGVTERVFLDNGTQTITDILGKSQEKTVIPVIDKTDDVTFYSLELGGYETLNSIKFLKE